MSLSQFAFDPPNGWRDPSRFPTYESEEAQVREDMQVLYDQIRDYINDTIVDSWNTSKAEQAALLPTTGANMKYLRRNTTSNVIETSTDGTNWQSTANSGHKILDSGGNSMPQRPVLQFRGCTVADENGATVVNGLNVLRSTTQTNLEGVIIGDGEHISARPLETAVSENDNPVTSSAVYNAVTTLTVSDRGRLMDCVITDLDTLPKTFAGGTHTDPRIPDFSSACYVVSMDLSNPEAQWSDWEVKVKDDNTFTITGEIFGKTDVRLFIGKPYYKPITEEEGDE